MVQIEENGEVQKETQRIIRSEIQPAHDVYSEQITADKEASEPENNHFRYPVLTRSQPASATSRRCNSGPRDDVSTLAGIDACQGLTHPPGFVLVLPSCVGVVAVQIYTEPVEIPRIKRNEDQYFGQSELD
jgi:hypothetical protein